MANIPDMYFLTTVFFTYYINMRKLCLPLYQRSFCIDVQDKIEGPQTASTKKTCEATSSAPMLKEEKIKIEILKNMEEGTLVKQYILLNGNNKKKR